MSTVDTEESVKELTELYASNKKAYFQYNDPSGVAQNTLIGGLSGAGLGALIGFLRERASADPEATGLDNTSLRTVLTAALLGAAGGGGAGFLASNRDGYDSFSIKNSAKDGTVNVNPPQLDGTPNSGAGAIPPVLQAGLDYIPKDPKDPKDPTSVVIQTIPKIVFEEPWLQDINKYVAESAHTIAQTIDSKSDAEAIKAINFARDAGLLVIGKDPNGQPILLDGAPVVIANHVLYGDPRRLLDSNNPRGQFISHALGWGDHPERLEALSNGLITLTNHVMGESPAEYRMNPAFVYSQLRQDSAGLTGNPVTDFKNNNSARIEEYAHSPLLHTLYPTPLNPYDSYTVLTPGNVRSRYEAFQELMRINGQKNPFNGAAEFQEGFIKPTSGQFLAVYTGDGTLKINSDGNPYYVGRGAEDWQARVGNMGIKWPLGLAAGGWGLSHVLSGTFGPNEVLPDTPRQAGYKQIVDVVDSARQSNVEGKVKNAPTVVSRTDRRGGSPRYNAGSHNAVSLPPYQYEELIHQNPSLPKGGLSNTRTQRALDTMRRLTPFVESPPPPSRYDPLLGRTPNTGTQQAVVIDPHTSIAGGERGNLRPKGTRTIPSSFRNNAFGWKPVGTGALGLLAGLAHDFLSTPEYAPPSTLPLTSADIDAPSYSLPHGTFANFR